MSDDFSSASEICLKTEPCPPIDPHNRLLLQLDAALALRSLAYHSVKLSEICGSANSQWALCLRQASVAVNRAILRLKAEIDASPSPSSAEDEDGHLGLRLLALSVPPEEGSLKRPSRFLDSPVKARKLSWEENESPNNQTDPNGTQMSLDGGQMSIDGGQMSIDGGQMSVDGPVSLDGGQMSIDGGPMSTDGGQMSLDGGQMMDSGAGSGVESPETSNSSPSNRYRKRWRPEETEQFIRLLNRFGPGSWASMHRRSTGALAQRDPMQLKDKWRNLCKFGQIGINENKTYYLWKQGDPFYQRVTLDS